MSSGEVDVLAHQEQVVERCTSVRLRRLQLYRWRVFFFSSRRRHTRLQGDWSSDVCSSDLPALLEWAEARNDAMPEGWSLSAEPRRDGSLELELRARDSADVPVNGLKPRAQLKIGRASCRGRG